MELIDTIVLFPPMPRLDHVRCYPLRFGLKVAALMPHLLEDCQVPECPPEANGKEIFQSMKYQDLWEDASLSECCVYVRGSTKLEIPPGWRELLPIFRKHVAP